MAIIQEGTALAGIRGKIGLSHISTSSNLSWFFSYIFLLASSLYFSPVFFSLTNNHYHQLGERKKRQRLNVKA